MTDFQAAMIVLGAIMMVFLLAWSVQSRRAVVVGTPKERIDVIGDEVAEIKSHQVEIARRQARTDHDVANIRAMIAALPSKDAVHKLEVEMATVSGRIERNHDLALSTSKAVDRIEAYLLNHKAP